MLDMGDLYVIGRGSSYQCRAQLDIYQQPPISPCVAIDIFRYQQLILNMVDAVHSPTEPHGKVLRIVQQLSYIRTIHADVDSAESNDQVQGDQHLPRGGGGYDMPGVGDAASNLLVVVCSSRGYHSIIAAADLFYRMT